MVVQFNQTVARAALGATGAALCAAICLLGATAPAHAATVDGAVPTATVSYADLDISRPEGLATLQTRLRRAATNVCSTGSGTSQEVARQEKCVRANVKAGMQTAISRIQVAAR